MIKIITWFLRASIQHNNVRFKNLSMRLHSSLGYSFHYFHFLFFYDLRRYISNGNSDIFFISYCYFSHYAKPITSKCFPKATEDLKTFRKGYFQNVQTFCGRYVWFNSCFDLPSPCHHRPLPPCTQMSGRSQREPARCGFDARSAQIYCRQFPHCQVYRNIVVVCPVMILTMQA